MEPVPNPRMDGRKEAIGRLRSTMEPAKVTLSDQLARINGRYIGTGRDDELCDHIDDLIVNAASAFEGEPGKRRALFVIGDSGSGKSTAIQHAIAARPEFAPYRDSDNQWIRPMVSFDAPGSLTLKVLATRLLKEIGYPVRAKLGEGEAWDLLQEQLAFRKVLFLHIDEMQHAVTSNNNATIEHLSNTVKSLLQIPDWPLHIIMSGVPALAAFRVNDLQMTNRSTLMEFEPMTVGESEMLRTIITHIIQVDAELIASKELSSDQFMGRLLRATGGAFGTSIQITRAAVSRVLRMSSKTPRSSKKEVTIDHFADIYADYTACPRDQNIFKAGNWEQIDPKNALARMQEAFKKSGKSKKKKP